MRKVLLMLMFTGMTFGAAAAGSWILKNKDQAAMDDSPSSPSPAGAASAAGTTPSSDGNLPIAVRPRPMRVEEILRFGMGLQRREKHLNEREESIKAQEQRLQLALADVRGEQQLIEGQQAKLRGQIDVCKSLLTQIEQAREALAADRESAETEFKEFSEVRIEANEQEQQNIKKMSEWFQGMEPEKAAGALKELVNDGKTELAVQLLANFEERDAAKILSALDDYALMIELAERFKDLKHPEKKKRR